MAIGSSARSRSSRAIIFCNTKVMCQRLSDDLKRFGIRRTASTATFRSKSVKKKPCARSKKKAPVLIATDVASRGIDVDDVDCVINYDVPEEGARYYIHPRQNRQSEKKGIAVSILGTFPDRRLTECKTLALRFQPVQFFRGRYIGRKAPKQKKPQPRRRFRR